MNETSRPDQTLADLVATAIAPVLIMALIGSLVFFLVEVAYIGRYYERLLWFVFFFIFGAVLVARMGMSGDVGSRANVYSLILGLVMWVALFMYVEFPPRTPAADFGWAIHLGFIVLILWSANRLTRDSTLDEDKADASGAGLLDVAGLDQKDAAGAVPKLELGNQSADQSAKKEKKLRRKGRGFLSWWERYQKYKEEKKERPRTHGVWVVYFSLAALPLFGLGQALIPADAVVRRQYAFWLMCIYVASGLGLLLTTTFLSLRRYLRQKKLRMPVAITTSWLFFGTTLIAALLVVGALLPRPNPEYSPVSQFFQGESSKRDGSEWAKGGGEPGEGDGAAASGNSKNTPDKIGDKGQPNQSGDKGPGQEKNGNPNSSSGEGDKSGGSDPSGKGKAQQGSGSTNSQDKKPGNDPGSKKPQGGTPHQGNPQNQNQKNNDGDKEQQDQDKQSSDAENSSSPNNPPNTNSWFEWIKPMGNILKWIVLIVVVVLVVFCVLRALLGFLANFTFWAKDLLKWLSAFWRNLFASEKPASVERTAAAAEAKKHRPFSWYRDPFRNGTAQQMSEVELIRYTFEALQAWARERDLARPTGETQLEFARRVGKEFPALEDAAHTLASYYATVAYAPDLLDADCANDMREFWQTLRDVTDRPLSAGSLSEV